MHLFFCFCGVQERGRGGLEVSPARAAMQRRHRMADGIRTLAQQSSYDSAA